MVTTIPHCAAETSRRHWKMEWIKEVLLRGGHLDTDTRYRLCTEDAGRWYG